MVFHILVVVVQEIVIQAHILFQFFDTWQMVGADTDLGFHMMEVVSDFVMEVFLIISLVI